MTHTNQVSSPSQGISPLTKRMLVGLGIGLAIISFFILSTQHPRPEWGRFWMVKPLIVTPLVGAICGACFHLMMRQFRKLTGWKKTAVLIITLIGYFIGLWMGIVLGLAGTLWN